MVVSQVLVLGDDSIWLVDPPGLKRRLETVTNLGFRVKFDFDIDLALGFTDHMARFVCECCSLASQGRGRVALSELFDLE